MRGGSLLAACLGALGGALGVLLLRPAHAPPPTDLPDAVRADATRHADNPGVPRLEASPSALAAELATARVRIEPLTAELQGARKQAAAPPAPPASQPAGYAGPRGEKLPQLARERAAEMGVPEATLQAVWDARWPYYSAQGADREALLARLRPLGDDAVRAVVALSGAGGGHVSLARLVRDIQAPGGSRLLLDLIARGQPGAGALVTALPGYDSPEVRTYLVDRIARETEAGTYWFLATALGALREPRGLEVMRLEQFTGVSFGGVRGYVLGSIAQMGGPRAIQLLDDYLRLPNADALSAALVALETLDAERARAHARRIKESDRYGFLPVEAISDVVRLAR